MRLRRNEREMVGILVVRNKGSEPLQSLVVFIQK